MKLVLLGDTHFGARGDSIAFHEHFEAFYQNIMFPYMKEHGLDRIVQFGDLFDRRKYINFATLKRSRTYFFDYMEQNNITFDVFIGNHDTSFKNTNDVNSPDLLLKDYKNINVYTKAAVVNYDGLDIALLPWICTDNHDDSIQFINETKAQVLFGHLEIQGFEMYRGAVNDHGFKVTVFDKFDLVYSGHFHHKSTRGNITYLGTPYEMTWSDWNDPKGFHIFDTETRTLTFIENPYKMFHKLHYDDSIVGLDTILDIDTSKLTGSYVKVITHNKDNPYWFDMFISKIEKSGVIDLQVVEDNLNLQLEDDGDIVDEAEDTLTILRKYCDQVSSKVDKAKLDAFLTDLYSEALSVE